MKAAPLRGLFVLSERRRPIVARSALTFLNLKKLVSVTLSVKTQREA